MVSNNILRFSSIITLARLAIPGLALSTRNKSHISWIPCGNATIPRECGQFEVPLDYANSTVGTASLAVARLNATVSPRLGTLFVNPGGPGESGVQWVLSDDMLLILNGTGGQYDIVSWDPRGVGSTVPKVQCFESGTAEKAFWNGSIRGMDLELRSDFTNTTARNEFYSHIDEVDSMLIKFGKQCNTQSKDMLKYIGTPATVRDMVALHDHLEGTKLINYWGISYGTLLGSFFVNMFPERVGRVIIDGVVNPWDWATKQPLLIGYDSVNSSDVTFNAFASSCANAGPSKCAIAQEGSTTDSIRDWVFNLIALAYDNTKATGGAIITSGQLRALLWSGMYHPREWPVLAQNLAQISVALLNTTNSTSTLRARSPSDEIHSMPFIRRANTSSSDTATDYAYKAITCADAVDAGNSTTEQGFETLVDLTNNHSRMFAPFIGWYAGGMFCHHWPVRAVERFTGPFNHTLQNKIVVIGNLADPITPFISAKAVADGLGDSAVLLKHNGYGHTSLYMHSNCTVTATSKYFVTGELPQPGTVCETDEQLFP
ncbi:hypothetical protein ACGC1H_000201 [Rhizoctonia solani]|uniref:Uncharacterized protein n=1 Tax=Rhizoctonia solani TaxID=456999 RepID=A0A8H3B706_9AGAM|nr:unnamed protein product [Rhizoctonia solani]